MKNRILVFLFTVICLAANGQDPAVVPPAEGAPADAGSEVSPKPDGAAVGTTPVHDESAKLPKALGRTKTTANPNNESSSYIGDSDSMDPLKTNRDSIKDDEEPVLEDIKEVLNAPKKAKASKKAVAAKGTKAKAAKTKKTKKTAKAGKAPKAADEDLGMNSADLSPDSPDLRLERKFHQDYKKFSTPVSDAALGELVKKHGAQTYVVQRGDTLSSISKIIFGDTSFWPKLWALNKHGILNPHFINPKTVLYFYPGGEDSAPGLSVAGSNDDLLSGLNKKTQAQRNLDLPAPLPKSLPLSRNKTYFSSSKPPEVVVNLEPLPVVPLEYENDIVITDAPLKSVVNIQLSEVSRFRCYDGRLVKDIRYLGNLDKEYEIFQPVEGIKLVGGTQMYVYKLFGEAEPYEANYLRITRCKDLISTSLVILPKGDIAGLKSKRMTGSRRPVLIGGPDVASQQLFFKHQLAYADFGDLSYEPGQEFLVQSQITDSVNGQIKIVEKYGSLAIVIVTEIEDVMAVGDKVITTN